MPTPEFILELRAKIGHAPLWLPGVTAVILRDDQVLLVRRSDNNEWTPVTGIVDPGEHPATAAEREAAEETGVECVVERLASVEVTDQIVYPNGDRSQYVDHTFRCRWVGAEPHVADDESVEVGWFAFSGLPAMRQVYLDRIDAARADEIATRLVR